MIVGGLVRKTASYIRNHINQFVFWSFFAITLCMTIPFPMRPLHTLTSPINGDAGYSSILFEAMKRENLNPYVDGTIRSVAYPDGISNNTGVNRVSFFSTLFLWVGTLVTNAVFAHSILAILGVVLSGFITYLFVKKLTNSTAPAILAGLTLMFMPVMSGILFSASAYTHMWLYTATIWIFWWLCTSAPSAKRFALALVLISLMLFWTPYYTFHILLIAAVGTIVTGVSYLRRYGLRAGIAFVTVMSVVLVMIATAYYFIGMSAQYAEVPHRTESEIYQQSAHPLMYVLPGAFSIFGQGLHGLLVQIVPRAESTSLYVGISVIIVAIFSMHVLRRGNQRDEKLQYGIILALTTVIVVFLFSLAPTIHMFGIDIPTPNYLIAKIVPSLRAGQRLVMPLVAGLTILVGIGAHEIGRHIPRNRRIIALACIGLVILADIISIPHARYTSIEERPLFASLSSRGYGLTAVYLHDSLVSNPGQYVCYPQFQHKMPLVNDCAMQRDPYNFDKPKKTLGTIISRPLCEQVSVLHMMDVRYLIVANLDNDNLKRCLDRDAPYAITISDAVYTVYEAKP